MPGFSRGVIGVALISVIRLLMGLPFAGGSAAFFGGFGGLFGWLWGVGTFNAASHEHAGMEHLYEHPAPGAATKLRERVNERIPALRATVNPLLSPLGIAIGVVVVIVGLFMVAGFVLPHREQTYIAEASATTVAGQINLPFDIKVNKTVFFLITVVAALGTLAVLAIIIALLMNALSKQVQEVKAAPNEPPKEEPLLFRLIDFFVTWVGDILAWTRRSVQR